jgi:bifunctional ADP-heptose synthase (sugar kinase/adenylyltransferase)
VDYVTIFDDPSVLSVVARMLPSVLVKGGHYTLDQIVGRDEVEAAGGRVVSIPIVPGYSTTAIIEATQRAAGNNR